jgi:branched-chain amino acid transport system substrate-binding protein
VKRLKGADIVSRQFASDRATDFSAILTLIRARHPDVIFYGGMDATAGPVLDAALTLYIYRNGKLTTLRVMR